MKYLEPIYFENNGRTLKKYVSPNGFYIKQVETGRIYGEAVDPITSTYHYIETEEKMVEVENEQRENN